MACVDEIHVGDIGTIFEMTISDCNGIIDVSTATIKNIVFKKPDKVIVTKNAVFKTDGTDGIIQYSTISNDLDLKGTWSIQALVTLPSGSWSSDINKFKVYQNL